MSVKQQRRVAQRLTTLLAELFDIPPTELDGINIRFHAYPPPTSRLVVDCYPISFVNVSAHETVCESLSATRQFGLFIRTELAR